MSDVALTALSLTEASALLRGGTVSSVELTDAYLARIDALDGRLRSFITVSGERARMDAARADAERAAGRWRGPLHGIPVAVKDLFDTAGIRTTANSKLLADRVPTLDSTVVRRLGDAGAVLLGKLQMNEFAMGPTAEDDFRPPARNPWDAGRSPGGSSSGSAVALAAGLCAGSFGSDTGGSIRAPAAYCGVVGLKPTFGRVSRHGVAVLSWSFDHAGPMARTVADVAELLQATAGIDQLDPSTEAVRVPDYARALTGSIRGLVVGAPLEFVAAQPGIEPDVLAAYRAAVETLRGLGAQVREIVLPTELEHFDASFTPILASEAAAVQEARLRARGGDFSAGFRRRVVEGYLYSAVDYVQAQRGRALITRAFDTLMTEVDLIATPVVQRTAPTVQEYGTVARSSFTSYFNLTGQPAIAVPCGFDRSGLPIGLMLAGRRFDEPAVLRAADAYERASGWRGRRPLLETAA